MAGGRLGIRGTGHFDVARSENLTIRRKYRRFVEIGAFLSVLPWTASMGCHLLASHKQAQTMKNKLLTLLSLGAVLAPVAALAQPAPSGFTNIITSAAGGTKTAFSITSFGDNSIGWAQSASTTISFFNVGTAGAGGAPAGAWDMLGTTNFSISPIGYLTNLQTGQTTLVDTVEFSTSSGVQSLNLVASGTPLTVLTNQRWDIVFNPEPAVFEIDLAFDNFNGGTYVASYGGGFITQTMEIEAIPEPSTYALLALSAAGLGGYVLRRRRK